MEEKPQHSSSKEGAPNGLQLPPNLAASLRAFQKQLWAIKIAEGALIGVIGLGLAFLAVFLIDRVIDTPVAFRIGLLIAGFCVPAIVIPLRWKLWINRQQSLEQIARLLRKRLPRLGDELLGIVELAKSQGSHGNGSERLVRAAMLQVDERVKNQDFETAIPAPRYRLWMSLSLGVILLVSALMLTVSEAAKSSLARWISPSRDVDRYTFAQLDALSNEVVVPYAEPFPIDAALSDDTRWKPERASIKVSRQTKLTADREEDRYQFSIPPRKEEGALTLRVGDEHQKIQVTPKPRPELKALRAKIRLPDYLLYQNDLEIPVQGQTLPLLRGSQFSLIGTLNRELATVDAEIGSATIAGNAFSTSPLPIDSPLTQHISWKDVYGLQAKDPLSIHIVPTEDHEPSVSIRQLSHEKFILDSEVISFDLAANDDFGVREMGLDWYAPQQIGSKEPVKGEKVVAFGNPEKRKLETRATFSAIRESVDPQTLHIRAFTEDYLPGRERTYSATLVLHILSPEEHSEWLAQEFRKWLRGTKEVYERERLLYNANQTLADQSAQDIDQPKTRRELAKQSSAEHANAKKLNALNAAGFHLATQAAKNPLFPADRLETWSRNLETLQAISQQKMPSVAENLQLSSHLPGAGQDDTDPKSPAQQALNQAIEDQKRLLDELAKIADELQSILSTLEASTFVRRLKAASRAQTEIAQTFGKNLEQSFGLPPQHLAPHLNLVREKTTEKAQEQSKFVYHIQTDLEAYFQRKQKAIYKNVLDQMKETDIVHALRNLGDSANDNERGHTISSSEFWSDTLDRWAEELVANSNSECKSNGKCAGLPPEIVLEIMRAVQKEMYLRDETREMESRKSGLSPDQFRSDVRPLEYTQQEIREHVDTIVDQITALPSGATEHSNEIQLLRLVSITMRQARSVLARPDTGPEAIAAQTEAIELLLQAKRQRSKSKGGGSGGGQPGGGGSGESGGAALGNLADPHDNPSSAFSHSREVEQSTGKSGRTLPEEFRRGLDTYFNHIDSIQ